MALFQQSSLTFGSAKQFIAEQASKQQTTEMLDRAGRSLQAAIKVWNKYNWSWLTTSTTLTFGTAGTAALPYDFREVYSLTWLGQNRRWIPGRNRRSYDRLYQTEVTQNEAPTRYDLYLRGGSGAISVLGALSASGSANLNYYRKMTEPCAVTFAGARVSATGISHLLSTAVATFANVKVGNICIPSTGWATASSNVIVTGVSQASDPGGTLGLIGLVYLNAAATATSTAVSGAIGADTHFLDIPSDYEWDIVAMAAAHFIAGVGGPDSKLQEFKELAVSGLQRAMSDDSSEEDIDISFMPPLPDPEQFPYNPNRTYE